MATEPVTERATEARPEFPTTLFTIYGGKLYTIQARLLDHLATPLYLLEPADHIAFGQAGYVSEPLACLTALDAVEAAVAGAAHVVHYHAEAHMAAQRHLDEMKALRLTVPNTTEAPG